MKLSTLLLSISFANSLLGENLPPLRLENSIIERLGISASPIEPHIVVDPVVATAQLSIDPTSTRSIASFFAGQIDKDLVQIGDHVEAQQKLATLRSREVATVISRFLESSAKFESARLLYQRESDLRDRKLTTEEGYQTARAGFLEARAAQQAARQEATLIRSPKDLAQLVANADQTDLTRLPIVSPVAGIVIEKSALSGQPVETNQKLFKVADLSHLNLEIKVPLQAAALIGKGDVITFQTVIGQPLTGEATVSRLSPLISEGSLTRDLLAVVDNVKSTWLPGTPVIVHLIDQSTPSVPATPSGALVSIEGASHVFVEETPGSFRPVPVTLGRQSRDFAEITSGPATGSKVVTTGVSLLLAAWEERSED